MSEALKKKLQARELVFGSWVSFSHTSITEIFTAQ
jgi:2-keto-3-deoxy-L-rhamnonate aldolase RhmA